MRKEILSNGLTVLADERKASPVTAVVTLVKTGYFNESDRLAGISHIIEHMFFKGTHRRPDPEDIARETKALGGILNASTSYESTIYYTVAPSENFERILDIQYDALSDPLLDPQELAKETEVVIQEARQKLDNAEAFSLEKTWELAFDEHRIRRWRIGYPDALRALTRDDLVEYINGRYAPSNIILCMIGGVSEDEMLRLAEKYHGQIPERPLAVDLSPPEPPQKDLKYTRISGDINQKLAYTAFHAPRFMEPDYYPLDIAVNIIGEGRSSRLYQSLVEKKQLASDANAFYSAYADVGVITLAADVLTDDIQQLHLAAFEVLENLKTEPERNGEIQKAKTRVESEFFFEQEQVLAWANRLATFEALGDYRLNEDYIEGLRKVTAEDVARAAHEYLKAANATILEYVPRTAELPVYEKADLAAKIMGLSVAETIPQPVISSVEAPIMTGRARRMMLANGSVLIVEEDRSSPVVGVAAYFRGGRLYEHRDIAGITNLALRSSIKGTRKLSAEQLANRVESLGTFIGLTNGSDYLGYSLRILSKYFAEGFGLVAQVISDATFPPKEVEKEREALLSDIRRSYDSSFGYARDLLDEVTYPDHPYGLPDLGTERTVSALPPEQVKQWLKDICVPSNAVFSVVGDVDSDSVARYIEDLFPDTVALPQQPEIAEAVFPNEQREKAVERERQQTAIAMGFPGVDRRSPDSPVLDVISAIMSGLGGRLFAEVRGRQGLAYVVSTSSYSALAGGTFVVYTATSPENEAKARESLLAEILKLREEMVTDDELERAKNYLRGAYLVALQTTSSRAREHASNEMYSLGLDGTERYLAQIAAVTKEDIIEAARRHFAPERYTMGIVRGNG